MGRRSMETIISSVISGLVALAVCLLNSNSQRRTADAKYNETIAIINVKIDNLASKVEKHNGVIERTYKLEEQTALQEEKIRVANHRIEDLEKERN